MLIFFTFSAAGFSSPLFIPNIKHHFLNVRGFLSHAGLSVNTCMLRAAHVKADDVIKLHGNITDNFFRMEASDDFLFIFNL